MRYSTPASQLRSLQENLDWYRGENLFRLSWIGPYFPQTDGRSLQKMAELERVFQEHNVIKELVDNWKDGLISQPFVWFLKDPRSSLRVEAAEAELQIQRWLDWVGQQALESDPLDSQFETSDVWTEFVLSLGVMGEGNLRLWQPVEFATSPDPVHRIHLHSPRVGSVGVRRSPNGFIEEISYSYGGNAREIQTRSGDVVTVFTDGGEDTAIALNTGGRWLIQQSRMPSLITPSTRKKQSSICHALTMKLRNQEIGGFRERTLFNCTFPEDAEGRPIDVERGPGIDQYLYSVSDAQGRMPASLHESQPVSVQTFIDSIEIDRSLLYLEHKQGHYLAANDGGLSGESRIQMRQGFELHLRGWKRSIEGSIGNILNIVLRLLGYENLEAVVELQITTGKLGVDERDVLIREFQAGLLSRATTIAKLGSVADVDAELALIDEEARADSAAPISDDPFELNDDPRSFTESGALPADSRTAGIPNRTTTESGDRQILPGA